MYIYKILCVYVSIVCIYFMDVNSYIIVPDIIKFTYYHCTSIDYSVLCE